MRFLLLTSLLLVLLVPAFADILPITDSGILNVENAGGTVLGITTSPSLCINFDGHSTCTAKTTHQMDVAPGGSNLFSPSSSTTDQIQDLLGSGSVTDFETVLGAGALAGKTIHFDLTSLVENGSTDAGNCGSNAGLNSCTPANSPFTLSMDGTGHILVIQFFVKLDAYTGSSSAGSTAYEGTFSTQVAGTLAGSGACAGVDANITSFISCEAAGGTVLDTWGATEIPTGAVVPGVPEPMSVVLMGSILCALIPRLRRFRSR
jgi:hypothetical protein